VNGQKEGSYLPSCVLTGGHGPFRGLVAPLALYVEHMLYVEHIDRDDQQQPMTENP
jgi:hypothetical protein